MRRRAPARTAMETQAEAEESTCAGVDGVVLSRNPLLGQDPHRHEKVPDAGGISVFVVSAHLSDLSGWP